MYHRDLGTQIGHTAPFSWDGEVLIFGHEPGGGSQAQCQATSSQLNRTLFFLDAETGDSWASSSTRGRRPTSRTAPGTTSTSCR